MENRKFKVLAPGIVQLEQIPRDFVFVFEFKESGEIKAVNTYTRKWIVDGVQGSHYTINNKVSTFICLCKLYEWLVNQKPISRVDFDWAINSLVWDCDVSNEPWGKFFQKMFEKFCI